MRASVTTILVIRQGGDHVVESLRALGSQTRKPERVVIVDSSADSTVQAQVDSGLSGIANWTLVNAPYGSSLADCIEEGMHEAYPGEQAIPDTEWVWLLRDDCVAHETALERLVLSVEGAPLVKIAGPKQRMADQPGVIREMGETMTRFGERMALAERELDQAQYDRLNDVLAVGEAGMLVSAPVLEELEGFDKGIGSLDGGLDLCVRARLAGHRVVVVPRSVVYVGSGPADWAARKKLSPLRGHYLARRAWLYRRFVYAPLWLLPLLALWVIPWSVARAGAQLFLKRPDRMVSEIAAGIGALLGVSGIVASRSVLSRLRTSNWATIDSLRLDSVDVRKRKSITREAFRAHEEERAARNPLPPLFPTLPWLIAGLTVVSGLVFGTWWGARYLQGGGIAPLTEPGLSLWSSVWALHPSTLGFDAPLVPSDPFVFILALLGQVTWWDHHFAMTALFVSAIPLAGASAWWGFSQVFSKAWTTTLAAFVWAVSPVFLLALADGRVGAVITVIALPWLWGTLVTAHESWQRMGQASLATVVVTATSPSLWPAVVLAVITLGVIRASSNPLRSFLGLIPLTLAPASLLAFPRFVAWWDSVEGRWWSDWGVLFADPGEAVAFSANPWWLAGLGWPDDGFFTSERLWGFDPSLVVVFSILLGVTVLALSFGSLAVGRPVVSLSFGLLVSLGLVTAIIAPALFSGYEGLNEVFVWPGAGTALIILGLLAGAGSLLDSVQFHDSLGNPVPGFAPWAARGAAGLIGVFAIVAPVVVGVTTWTSGISVQPTDTTRTLPAFVAAEAVLNPSVGTIVIESTDSGYGVSLSRGLGETLMESSTLVRGRGVELTERDEDLARLAAMLIRPSAAEPGDLFDTYGIRFVLLKDQPDSLAALTLAQIPELVSASAAEGGQLWLVAQASDTPETADPASPSIAQLWFLGALGVASILAVPTERRVRGHTRPIDDAVPSLGEETSDDL